MALSLFEHNQQAYVAVEDMLDEVGRAAVVHPTGTGKSFIAFKLCEQHSANRICWLSPSAYIYRTQLENVRMVCPDFSDANIMFFTYSKLMNLTMEEIENIAPAYIILDEFHRCGAQMWGEGVARLLETHPRAKLLGLSATAVRYLDHQRDMADELFDGNVASDMTLGEAVVRGILQPPRYVTAVYTYRESLKKYETRVARSRNTAVRREGERYLQALRRALEQADGLDIVFQKHLPDPCGKYIVFCANAEHMREMITHVDEWFSKIDAAPHVYSAYSNDPETSAAFHEFKHDTSSHLKLLFCIDMLNEGVHVDGVSGVILFRPTVSPIIFKQQIGRALSASGNHSTVIIDVVNNIENLYSIADLRDEMQEAVVFYQRIGEDRCIVNERFRVIDELQECKRLFDELERTLSVSWETMYAEACEYVRKYGNLLPLQNYETPAGYKLGQWVVAQRNSYAKGTLLSEKITRLDAIGMSWLTLHERQWEEGFSAAFAYAAKHGSIRKVTNNPRLAAWVVNQRHQYLRGRLTADQVSRLESLGMLWETESHWALRLTDATRFYKEHGHLDIPVTYVTPQGGALGQWYRSVRNQYRNGTLSDERRRQLEQIGMQWDSRSDRVWQQKYEFAKAYAEEHGHLLVPVGYVTDEGERLGVWVSCQREAYAKGSLSKERITMLERIGMSWQRDRGRWENGFAHAEQYAQDHGDLIVSPDYITEDGFRLGIWIANQRQKYKKNTLKANQIERLESIGMCWDPARAFWENACTHAVAFFRESEHWQIPSQHVCEDGFRLGAWWSNTKTRYKHGTLLPYQLQDLEQMGIIHSLPNKTAG